MADTYVVSSAPPVNSADAPNVRSWKFHLDRITTVWRKGARDVIAVGQYLLAAQDELSRDAFTAMTKKLDFNGSVVRKLTAIARNETLCSPGNSNLPREWTVLYQLSQLSEGTLKAALADGRIFPGMSRANAIALKPAKKTATKSTTAEPSVSTPADLTIDLWESFPKDQRRAFLDQLGREELCAVMSPTLLAEFRDYAIGPAVAGASNSTNFARYATDKLHAALYCARRPEPDMERVAALLNCIAKNAADRGVAGSDIVISEGKPKARK